MHTHARAHTLSLLHAEVSPASQPTHSRASNRGASITGLGLPVFSRLGLSHVRAEQEQGRHPYSATSGLPVAPLFPSLDYHFKLHSSLLLFESLQITILPLLPIFLLLLLLSFTSPQGRSQPLSPVVLSLPQPEPQCLPPIPSCSLHFQLLSLTTSL